MERKELLLKRLDEIGQALVASGQGLALIALGSVGLEMERLDEYSDLDFFAIVQPGQKQAFINDLGWLEQIQPLVYRFKNTPDGYKLLFADGIFCEFAVFEAPELPGIPFAPGRLVWKAAGVEDTIATPSAAAAAAPATVPAINIPWQVDEALTNLYVGLCRERRGERLSACRFIQSYAVERVIELAEQVEQPQHTLRDPFNRERRLEQRLPRLAEQLGPMVQGYEHNLASAQAVLAYLSTHFPEHVNPALQAQIEALI